jgi:hypothetical protein
VYLLRAIAASASVSASAMRPRCACGLSALYCSRWGTSLPPVAVRPRCAWGLSAPYCPAGVGRSPAAVRPRCACGFSAPYRPAIVRRCARCRYAGTTCRGVLLVGCRAPALRLCPLCCVPPARPATAPLCVRPRCAGGHSAPYRPAILCRSSAAVRPRCAWGFSAPYRPLW